MLVEGSGIAIVVSWESTAVVGSGVTMVVSWESTAVEGSGVMMAVTWGSMIVVVGSGVSVVLGSIVGVEEPPEHVLFSSGSAIL